MVPATLFKSVRSSSHEQSVPTCMNKPVNNHVQAGQLNHVQACQQAKTSCAFLRVYNTHARKNIVYLLNGDKLQELPACRHSFGLKIIKIYGSVYIYLYLHQCCFILESFPILTSVFFVDTESWGSSHDRKSA